MQRTAILAATIAVGLGFAIGAQAQTISGPMTTSAKRPHTAASETGRDVAQQKRIEQGLQSGQLTSGEARGLEAGEAHIEKTEQRALRNGTLSAPERAQIQHQQNRESRAIYGQKHDARTCDPDSPRSSVAQADVQRNLDQQLRLHNGVTQGSLTNRELGRAEGAEARVGRMEVRRGTLRNTGRVQRADNRTSRGIYRAKHNRRGRH
ncbi:MAG TPA: hypothetical protein VJ722_07975 [Rhodanobacteraceae bacterium]|nr:hypothetical protein [Rhodanobacteraceae bacterium]